MRIFQTASEMRRALASLRQQDSRPSIGFVPTMGDLHKGHLSLLQKSKAECAVTICSIFVNPTQFDDPVDFEKYPKELAQDIELCEQAGVDFLFMPQVTELYPEGYRFKVTENDLSQKLCGAHRPGHFDGVLTVVMKLLNLVSPERAYFGEKDYQQLTLIRDMTRAFFLNVEIVACATIREPSGLALSSRNSRLSSEQKNLAARLNQVLRHASSAQAASLQLAELGFDVDYVEDNMGRRIAAARLGSVRLIDNISLSEVELKSHDTHA